MSTRKHTKYETVLEPKPKGMPLISCRYSPEYINTIVFPESRDVNVEGLSLYKTLVLFSSFISSAVAYDAIAQMQTSLMTIVDLDTVEDSVWHENSIFLEYLTKFRPHWDETVQEYFNAQIEKGFLIQFDRMCYQPNFPFARLEKELQEFGMAMPKKVKYYRKPTIH